MGAGKTQPAEAGQIIGRVLARVRQHDDVAPAGGDPGQAFDGPGIGSDAVMQHAILVDEIEVELIGNVAQAVDPLHDDDPAPTPLSASRATPTAASSFAEATTGTPRAAVRMRRQIS